MPDLSDEQEIFAAAELKEEAAPASEPAPEGQEQEVEAPEPEEQEQGTDADPDSGDPEGQQADQRKEPTRIAYSRFKEVNEEKKALRTELEQERTAAREREQNLLRMIEQARSQPAQASQPQAEEQTEEDILAAFLANPRAVLQQQLTPFEHRIASLQDDLLESRAQTEHGAEKMSAAKQWIEELATKNPQEAQSVYQRVKAARNPYSELVAEHRRQSLLNDIGPDPAAYEARLREKILAELQGGPAVTQQQTTQQPGRTTQAPPSLVRAAGNAGISEQGALTEEDIFNAAPAFGKRRA